MTAKMNPTSLYITTSQLILKADPNDPSTWEDLYRLVPYLRNIFCCVVCANILKEPLTPSGTECQHHICKNCRGERKRIKPTCKCSKGCKYTENKSLRLLVQCYKRLCIRVLNSPILEHLQEQAENPNINSISGVERGAGNLIMLLQEGAAFEDDYVINVGIPKTVYSILPCVYTNSQLVPTRKTKFVSDNNQHNIAQDVPLYSVSSTGSGNKITIKRKSHEAPIAIKPPLLSPPGENVLKKLPTCTTVKVRHGCRCGNATAIPGKLTCCGQRCPCYVDSKPCLDCKCRGCRNPHRPDGNKVRPITIPLQREFLQPILVQSQSQLQPTEQQVHYETPQFEPEQLQQQFQQHLLQQQQIRQQHIQQQQKLQQQQIQQQQELHLQRLQQQELRQLQERQLRELQQQQQYEQLEEYNKQTVENGDFLAGGRTFTLEELTEHLASSNLKVIKTFPISPGPTTVPHTILISELESDDDINVI